MNNPIQDPQSKASPTTLSAKKSNTPTESSDTTTSPTSKHSPQTQPMVIKSDSRPNTMMQELRCHPKNRI